MDKIKEKMDKLKLEAEAHLARAEKAEGLHKELENHSNKLETENHNLNNKIILLQESLEKAEKRLSDVFYPYCIKDINVHVDKNKEY